MLIVNELGHEVRLEVALETVYGGTILMEVKIEFQTIPLGHLTNKAFQTLLC